MGPSHQMCNIEPSDLHPLKHRGDIDGNILASLEEVLYQRVMTLILASDREELRMPL